MCFYLKFTFFEYVVAKSFKQIFCVIFLIADYFYLSNSRIVNLERNYEY